MHAKSQHRAARKVRETPATCRDPRVNVIKQKKSAPAAIQSSARKAGIYIRIAWRELFTCTPSAHPLWEKVCGRTRPSRRRVTPCFFNSQIDRRRAARLMWCCGRISRAEGMYGCMMFRTISPHLRDARASLFSTRAIRFLRGKNDDEFWLPLGVCETIKYWDVVFLGVLVLIMGGLWWFGKVSRSSWKFPPYFLTYLNISIIQWVV